MVIYQTLNEQNYPIGEFLDLVVATHVVKDLSLWLSEHYYHIETTEFEDDMSWVGAA